MTKDNFEWLLGKLVEISEFGREVNDGGATTDYGYHTALKLVTLRYVSGVFSTIASADNQKAWGFDGAVYVDLFAGTGLVKIKENGDLIAGSPVCAVKGRTYDYSIFVEKAKRRHKILNKRMERVLAGDEFRVIRGDSNDVVGEVIRTIKERFKKPIVLVFVDPQGMEIKFETLKALSDEFKNCDFLINVNALGVKRVAGQVGSKRPISKKTLGDYLDEDWQKILLDLSNGKSVEEKYSNRMRKILGKQIDEDIVIRDNHGGKKYVLLCCTRQTRGGSPYRKAWQDLKGRIERLDGDMVRGALDQVNNRSRSINDYKKTPRQSKLTDWAD